MMRLILWLNDIMPDDQGQVGDKALNLAEVKRAGFRVPDGFCLTVAAYESFVAANDLEPVIGSLPGTPGSDLSAAALRLQETMRVGRMPPELRAAVLSAYRELAPNGGVAVRSSATAEDLPAASFAGQQDTLLNIRDEGQLLQAIVECWASLWSPQAVSYRVGQGVTGLPAMALLVQEMVNPRSAGVAFSQDPVTAAVSVVIEAAWGLGETVVRGSSDVDRYVVSRDNRHQVGPPLVAHKQHQRVMAPGGGLQTVEVSPELQDARVLDGPQVQQISRAALGLEEHFGCPQDIEWAWADEQLYILQSRPITRGADRFFTTAIPGDDRTWTSGFLNERFPLPVSPLGWTVINELLERLAFRDPLRYLGVRDVEGLRVSRLYRGHPYINLFVFQTLYKVFPDWLLPEDACRYFPSGNTALRRAVSYPRSLFDPRFLFSMLWHFLRQPALWSPWHNYRVWAAFVAQHGRRCQALQSRYEHLQAVGATALEVWSTISEAQDLNAGLLAVHRWSLTCADLTYGLLRRIVRAWVKRQDAPELFTHLVTGLPNKSVEMNSALRNLARQSKDTPAFDRALRTFLEQYGHRSFCLDIYHPSFADDPAQVLDLVQRLKSQPDMPGDDRGSRRQEAQRMLRQDLGRGLCAWPKRAVFDHLAYLTQCYMPLREDQRFYWQKTLALQRKLFLLLGRVMVRSGALRDAEHIFFLTVDDVKSCVQGEPNGPAIRPGQGGAESRYAHLAAARQLEFARLCREFAAAPERAYPPFLQGNQPLALQQGGSEMRFQGRAVSPGLARGRVVVLHSPAEFGKVAPGDVLVASGVDPAWTPVFGLLSALVLEHGGQLSHAAIVAREYGLPAVAGIQGITALLHDGDEVLVDGLNGWVSRVA